MKATQFFISTLKEAPADAEITSHQLMVRAGLITQMEVWNDSAEWLMARAGLATL